VRSNNKEGLVRTPSIEENKKWYARIPKCGVDYKENTEQATRSEERA
jgi:hypothetical protein